MTVKEIVGDFLTKAGFDGLVNSIGSCGCEVSDLMPCADPQDQCEPGHKVDCHDDGSLNENTWCGGLCDWHMKPGRKKV